MYQNSFWIIQLFLWMRSLPVTSARVHRRFLVPALTGLPCSSAVGRFEKSGVDLPNFVVFAQGLDYTHTVQVSYWEPAGNEPDRTRMFSTSTPRGTGTLRGQVPPGHKHHGDKGIMGDLKGYLPREQLVIIMLSKGKANKLYTPLRWNDRVIRLWVRIKGFRDSGPEIVTSELLSVSRVGSDHSPLGLRQSEI
jgi:hypothetical protein